MKVVICGGGTAGWLAALMIKKVQGDSHDVTVIESSKIGIIGAGEGSTGYLTDIIQGVNWDYGCNEADFLRETDATVKLGIRHKNWKHNYTYDAPLDGSSSLGQIDYLLMHTIINDIPFQKCSTNGYVMSENKSGFYIDENGELNNKKIHAYHFDAVKVGKYLKRVTGNSINHIDSKIVDVDVDDFGDIRSVTLEDNRKIYGDFFIDCSGFKRVLANALNVKWKTYNKNLTVNSALAFLLPYEDQEKIEPLTTAWALSSGWMWQIPTRFRKGCGYVFDDNFISKEEAHDEIEKVLGKKIDPINYIKFDSGRCEKLWHRNCLFLGLCAAFAEPLEATSIHSTIVQLQSFIFEYLRDTKEETCNQGSINIYNNRMTRMYDDFKDFLVLHYMTDRKDSDFWRFIQTKKTITDTVSNVLEISKVRSLQGGDLDSYYGYAGPSLYNWILTGLGYIDKEVARKDLEFYGKKEFAETVWNVHCHNYDNVVSSMIDNDDFTRNMDKYLNGYNISK